MSHSTTRISSNAHDRQRGVVMHMKKKSLRFKAFVWKSLCWLVCRLERQWRKRFEYVQRHCSEDYKNGTIQTAGGRAVLAAKAVMSQFLSSSSTETPLRLHKPHISHKVRLSATNRLHYVLPINNFFTLCPYEMLFFRGQDAQRVFLACPGLSIDDIRALVHVNCSLW